MASTKISALTATTLLNSADVFPLVQGGVNKKVAYSDFVTNVQSDLTLTSADISNFTEDVQDTIGGILVNTSTITLTYLDGVPSITADVIQSGIDHGSISGLADDDHTQYHNNARGDARYYTQTQLNAGQLDTRYYTETEVDTLLGNKQNTITGAASTVTTTDLTTNRVVISNGLGKIDVSTVTTTTLGYLDATSSIQTQLNTISSDASNRVLKAGDTMSGQLVLPSMYVNNVGDGYIWLKSQASAVPSSTNTDGVQVFSYANSIIGIRQDSGTGSFSALVGISGLSANRTYTLPNSSGEILLRNLQSARIFVGDGSNIAQPVAVSGDITLSNTGDAQIATGAIVNNDISASAAIGLSKLAALTVSRALVSDGSGVISASTTTSTEIGYISGLTSSAQTQINTKVNRSGDVFTGAVTASVVTLTDASTIAVNATAANQFEVTITASRTLGNPTGAVDGQLLLFAVRQNGTGGWTLTPDTKYRFGDDIEDWSNINLSPNKITYIGCRYDATDDRFDVIAFKPGY